MTIKGLLGTTGACSALFGCTGSSGWLLQNFVSRAQGHETAPQYGPGYILWSYLQPWEWNNYGLPKQNRILTCHTRMLSSLSHGLGERGSGFMISSMHTTGPYYGHPTWNSTPTLYHIQNKCTCFKPHPNQQEDEEGEFRNNKAILQNT